MKRIMKIVDRINEEINDAKHYAENYLYSKMDSDSLWSVRYKEMAEDELKHADYMHDLAMKEITAYRQYYEPPKDMLEKWDKAHQKYIEKVNIINNILSA